MSAPFETPQGEPAASPSAQPAGNPDPSQVQAPASAPPTATQPAADPGAADEQNRALQEENRRLREELSQHLTAPPAPQPTVQDYVPMPAGGGDEEFYQNLESEYGLRPEHTRGLIERAETRAEAAAMQAAQTVMQQFRLADQFYEDNPDLKGLKAEMGRMTEFWMSRPDLHLGRSVWDCMPQIAAKVRELHRERLAPATPTPEVPVTPAPTTPTPPPAALPIRPTADPATAHTPAPSSVPGAPPAPPAPGSTETPAEQWIRENREANALRAQPPSAPAGSVPRRIEPK